MRPIALSLRALAKGCVCASLASALVWVLSTWIINLEELTLLLIPVSLIVAMVAVPGGLILVALFGVPAYFILRILRCANLPVVAIVGAFGGWRLNVSMGFMNNSFEFLGHAAPGAIIIMVASAALMIGLHLGVVFDRDSTDADDARDWRGMLCAK